MNVLTVDDSRASRLVIGRFLTDLGFRVTEAEDGNEGLRHLRGGGKFDVILVDWEMPGMSGVEFIRAVRSEAATMDTPIIMISTLNSSDRLVEALEAGANEYIMKPFTKEILSMKLDLLGVESK